MSNDGYTTTPLKVTCSVANNGVTTILNTTAWDGRQLYTTIGEHRGLFLGWRLVGTILCVTQNVTLSARRLINGAWAQDVTADTPWTLTSGDLTITAAAAAQTKFNWLLSGESLLYITNGATGPTILSFDGYLTDNPNPGV